MIKQIYNQAISQIEATRAREIETAKQRVTQEQIIPFNKDIDLSLQKAFEELLEEQNARIAKIHAEYEARKSDMRAAAENKKAQFADSAIGTAVYAINANADKALAPLKKYLSEQGE